jgi:hypothetical protein
MRFLAEPLQVAMDNGARKALIPLKNKRNFLEVSGEAADKAFRVNSGREGVSLILAQRATPELRKSG